MGYKICGSEKYKLDDNFPWRIGQSRLTFGGRQNWVNKAFTQWLTFCLWT